MCSLAQIAHDAYFSNADDRPNFSARQDWAREKWTRIADAVATQDRETCVAIIETDGFRAKIEWILETESGDAALNAIIDVVGYAIRHR